MKTKLPILILTFNRPEHLKKVLDAVSKVQPDLLYISADGPRFNVPSDKRKCAEVRKIISDISWPCEVHTLIAENNGGIGVAVETGITWFFNNVEEGVVLEDDMIPTEDFFSFAEAMLDKYRDDQRIGCISGSNFQNGKQRGDGSYYFSHYPSWGYAMWKRTWKQFDSKLDTLERFERMNTIDKELKDPVQRKFWLGYFRKIRNGKFNFTDARFTFSLLANGAYTIIPNVNLIQNVGFDDDSTNTTDDDRKLVMTSPLGEIIHPSQIVVHAEADDYFFYRYIYKTFPQLVRAKLGIEWRKLLQKISL